jgi:hypothetical protein
MRLLAKDPAARPQTAREVADELARIADGEAAGLPSSPPVREKKSPRRR